MYIQIVHGVETIGYPKYKKTPMGQINMQRITSELTCRYCGRVFASIAQLRGHLGQCVKRGAFLKKLERGVIVIVHRKYFHIMPKSYATLKHIETFLALYKERDGQPELWEKDINTFLGALTALHMEKKLTFEMIEKEEAWRLAHSVAEVYTDDSIRDMEEPAPSKDITPTVDEYAPYPEEAKEAKPLVKIIKEKKLKKSAGKQQD